MSMPIIDADELNTRYNEFLRQIRKAFSGPLLSDDADKRNRIIKEAQRQFAAWFQARGIMLIFPEEDE